jgi:hypothetical protein
MQGVVGWDKITRFKVFGAGYYFLDNCCRFGSEEKLVEHEI